MFQKAPTPPRFQNDEYGLLEHQKKWEVGLKKKQFKTSFEQQNQMFSDPGEEKISSSTSCFVSTM